MKFMIQSLFVAALGVIVYGVIKEIDYNYSIFGRLERGSF